MSSRISFQAYSLMALLLLLWGSFAAVSKWSLQYITSWQMQFFMFYIALFVMLLLLPAKDHAKQVTNLTKKNLFQLSVYGVFSYLYYAFYTASLKLIPATEASMLNYLFPIFIVILAVCIERMKLTWPKLLLMGAGILGTSIIITNGELARFAFTDLLGDLLAILGAFSWAMFTVLGKRDRTPMFASIFVYVIVSCVCSTVSMFAFSSWSVPAWPVLTGIAWLALSNIVISYFLWFRILQIAPTALVSGVSYITPFVTLLFIFLFLGERMSWVQGVGFVLIMAGVLLYRRLERERAQD